VVGGRKTLHNVELHNLYKLPDIIRVIKPRSGANSKHGRDEKCIKFLIRKHKGKRPCRRPGHRWEDNIRMGFWETG
jgi:hypothetical protein